MLSLEGPPASIPGLDSGSGIPHNISYMLSSDDASQLAGAVGGVVGAVGGLLGIQASISAGRTRRSQSRLERQLHVRPEFLVNTAPPMPVEVEGYERSDEQLPKLRTRLVSGEPSAWPDFPVTMSGCTGRLWTMRWRSIGTPIDVYICSFDFSGVLTDEIAAQSGYAGLAKGTGCDQPVFLLPQGESGESTLTDIVAEVTIWLHAP
jgi:hypothetical protein